MAPSTEPLILIVEDDPGHSALIQAQIKQNLTHAKLDLVHSGWDAQAYLSRGGEHPLPALIVLDLGLPDVTAIGILEWMAKWKWMTKIPVIVFTASENPEHERRAYELGVRRYMSKTDGFGELATAVREELDRSEVANDEAVTDGADQEAERLSAEPKRPRRLTGLALFSLSLFGMMAIVVTYEAMRFAATSGAIPFPIYVTAASYSFISALVLVYCVTRLRRRRRLVEIHNESLIVALQDALAEVQRLLDEGRRGHVTLPDKPNRRVYLDLREEGDRFLGLLRVLNQAAVAREDGPEHDERFRDTLGEMHTSVDRMSELAG